MMESETLMWSARIRLFLVLLLLGMGFMLLRPFLGAILWAIILAILFAPLHRWLLKCLPSHQNAVSMMIVLFAGALVVGPTTWALYEIQAEASLAYHELSLDRSFDVIDIPDRLAQIPLIGQWLHDLISSVPLGAHSLLLELKGFIPVLGRTFGFLFRGVAHQALQLVLTAICLFFFLKDADRILQSIRNGFSGIMGPSLEQYLETIRFTIQAVSLGIFGSALAQGCVAALGYAIAGMKTPLLLGLVSVVASMVPVLGASLIWGPIVIVLIIENHLATALGLTIWGVILVHPVDNLLRPWLIGHILHFHILLVVLGVIGGVFAFGLVGVFVGPCILGLIMTLWMQWTSASMPKGI